MRTLDLSMRLGEVCAIAVMAKALRPGWVKTRYEEKARNEGRIQSFYFTFQRT